MTDQKKVDLSDAIQKTSSDVDEALGFTKEELDPLQEIVSTIQSFQDSLASVHISIRILSERLNSMERYVSYLLEQDPKMGPKIKEQLSKLDASNDKQV